MAEKSGRSQIMASFLYSIWAWNLSWWVGSVNQTESTYPTSCMEGRRPAPHTVSLAEHRVPEQERNDWLPGCPEPCPGTLTAKGREAKRREPCACSPSLRSSSTKKGTGAGLVFSFCDSVTPPTGKQANWCPLLSADEELLPPLPLGKSKNCSF